VPHVQNIDSVLFVHVLETIRDLSLQDHQTLRVQWKSQDSSVEQGNEQIARPLQTPCRVFHN
jgi:hypothetical protein